VVKVKVKAPCPGSGSTERPCGKGKGKADGGVIFVLPLLAGTAAWATRPERLRRRTRGR